MNGMPKTEEHRFLRCGMLNTNFVSYNVIGEFCMNRSDINKFSFPEKIPPRRTLVLAFSIAILGLGVALFKWSRFGNDPSSSMVMAFADRFNSTFTVMLVVFNGIWFIAEILLGRHHIGVGTFINWLFTGFFADQWIAILHQ